MIDLRATNSQLTINAKHSFLSDNYASGVSSINVDSIIGISDGDYLLISSFGSETAEIMLITGITEATNAISFAAETTKFAHPESTKVTIIPYNKVEYYHTTTATFSDDTVLATIDIQADSLYTTYSDSDHQNGFGWFKFKNETTLVSSQVSNAIRYAGANKNSVKKIFDGFYSLLNDTEKRLIKNEDALRYINQAYAVVTNELNLVNSNYNVSDEIDISVVAGTAEYDLADDFSDVVSCWHSDNGEKIEFIKISEVPEYNENTSGKLRYYLRGSKIGFVPTPTEATTVKMRYKKNSTAVTSLFDDIDIPENNYYIVIDYMVFLAKQKLNNSQYMDYYKLFQENIKTLKLTSHKRSSSLDNWKVSDLANI